MRKHVRCPFVYMEREGNRQRCKTNKKEMTLDHGCKA